MTAYLAVFVAGVLVVFLLQLLTKPLLRLFASQRFPLPPFPSKVLLEPLIPYEKQAEGMCILEQRKVRLMKQMIKVLGVYYNWVVNRYVLREVLSLFFSLPKNMKAGDFYFDTYFLKLQSIVSPKDYSDPMHIPFQQCDLSEEFEQQLMRLEKLDANFVLSGASETPSLEIISSRWYFHIFPELLLWPLFYGLWLLGLPFIYALCIGIDLETQHSESLFYIDQFLSEQAMIEDETRGQLSMVGFWLLVYYLWLLPIVHLSQWVLPGWLLRSKVARAILPSDPVSHRHIEYLIALSVLWVAILLPMEQVEDAEQALRSFNATFSSETYGKDVFPLLLSVAFLPLILLQRYGADGLVLLLKVFVLDGIFQWLQCFNLSHIFVLIWILYSVFRIHFLAGLMLGVLWMVAFTLPLLLICWNCKRGIVSARHKMNKGGEVGAHLQTSLVLPSDPPVSVCLWSPWHCFLLPATGMVLNDQTEEKHELHFVYPPLNEYCDILDALNIQENYQASKCSDCLCLAPYCFDYLIGLALFTICFRQRILFANWFTSRTLSIFVSSLEKPSRQAVVDIRQFQYVVLCIDDDAVQMMTRIIYYIKISRHRRHAGHQLFWINCNFRKEASVRVFWDAISTAFVSFLDGPENMYSSVERTAEAYCSNLKIFVRFQDTSGQDPAAVAKKLLQNTKFFLSTFNMKGSYEFIMLKKMFVTGLHVTKKLDGLAYEAVPSPLSDVVVDDDQQKKQQKQKQKQRMLFVSMGSSSLLQYGRVACVSMKQRGFLVTREEVLIESKYGTLPARYPYWY